MLASATPADAQGSSSIVAIEVVQPTPGRIQEDYRAGSDIHVSVTVQIPIGAAGRELYLSIEAGDRQPASFSPRFASPGGARQWCRNSPSSPKVSVDADLLIIDHAWVNSTHPGTGILRSDGSGAPSGITVSPGDPTGEPTSAARQVVYSVAFAVVCDDDLVEEDEQLTIRAWLMPNGATNRSTPAGAFAQSVLIIDDDSLRPPTNLVLSYSGTTVTASWDKPEGTGSVQPDGYILRYREVGPGDNSWQEIAITGGDTLTRDITGLTRGSTYRFQVRSTKGGSAPSEWSTEERISIPVITASGVPQNVSLAGNDTLLVLSWNEPANHRDFPNLTYEVEFRQDGGPWTSTGVVISGTSASLTGVLGRSYQARVRAGADGAWSDWVFAGPVRLGTGTTPGTIQDLTFSADGIQINGRQPQFLEEADAEQILDAVIPYTVPRNHPGGANLWMKVFPSGAAPATLEGPLASENGFLRCRPVGVDYERNPDIVVATAEWVSAGGGWTKHTTSSNLDLSDDDGNITPAERESRSAAFRFGLLCPDVAPEPTESFTIEAWFTDGRSTTPTIATIGRIIDDDTGGTPGAPLNLTLRSEGGDLFAAWDEPANAEEITVISYTLRYRGTGINDRWRTTTVDDDILQARIRASQGIELDGTYRAQVRATGTSGNGPWSAEAETTLPTAGPKPVITTAVQPPANRPFTVNITFSEPVTRFTIDDLDVDGGTASNFAGAAAAYTALITPTGSSGTLTIDIPAGAARNADKYESEAADTFTIATDVTAPTGTITAAETGPYRSPFRITMTFSEPIRELTVEDFSVTLGQVSNLAATGGSSTVYTAIATPAGSGTLVIEIGTQTFYDFNGHRNEDAIRFEAEIDTIRPTVTITSTTPPPVTGPFALTFTFSEDVTGFERDDIEFPTGAGFMQTLHRSGRSYTGTARPTVTGQVLVRVPENAASDAIGHGNEQAEFEITAIVDEDPNRPTVDIWTPATGPVRGPFELRISFSKPVVGMTADALKVKNGEIGALIDNQAARIEYSTTLWPKRNGPVTVNMAAGVVTDDMDNPNTAAPEFSIEALLTPVPAVPTVGLLLLGAALAAAGWRRRERGART